MCGIHKTFQNESPSPNFSETNPKGCHGTQVGEQKERVRKHHHRVSKQTTFNDSITGVNPVRTHGFGVYRGNRRVWSVRVDEKLLNDAKPVLKAKFGSECRGVETWLAGLVATTKGEQLTGVYPSNTVEIGKLVIERNLRERRKLVVEEDREVKESSKTVCCSWCHREAVATFQNRDTGHQAYACDYHQNFLKTQPSWSLKASSPSKEVI